MDHSYSQSNERHKLNDDESLPEISNSLEDNVCEKPIDVLLCTSNKLDPDNDLPTPETPQEPSQNEEDISIFEHVIVKEERLTPEFFQQTGGEQNDASSPQYINVSLRESCDGFRKLMDEIKQENEEENVDDTFCVDGITDSKESDEKINFERWKTENLFSIPSEFLDQENNVEYLKKSFKCTTCSKRFLTKTLLTKHLVTHSEQCFRCSFCDFNTKRKDYLRVHEKNHQKTKIFKCLKCNFETNVRSRLRIHESIHSEEKYFQCFKCDYKTSRKDNLKLHEFNHLDTKRFKCEHCEYESNSKRNLKVHMLNHLKGLGSFKSPESPYKKNIKGDLKLLQGMSLSNKIKHYDGAEVKIKEEPIEAEDKYFYEDVLHHDQIIFSTVKVKADLTCPECNFKTTYKSNLKRHKQTHADSKRFHCSKCNYKTNRSDDFKIHLLDHSNLKLFKCSECDYETNIKSNLNAHMLTHSDARFYKCPDCDYQAKRKRDLKRHSSIHAGSKNSEKISLELDDCNRIIKQEIECCPNVSQIIKLKTELTCPECNFESRYKSNLKRHILTHTDSKLFNCSDCNYKSNRSDEYKIHLLDHCNLKLFKCSECDYETNIKANLNGHVLTHSDTRFYKCPDCVYQAKRQRDLKRHSSVHTGPK